MILRRTQLNTQNRLLAKADQLKSKVDTLASKVANLDGHCELDKDGVAGSVSIKDSVPSASAFGRLFSSAPRVTADVQVDSKTDQPRTATIEHSSGLMTRDRFELKTGDDGSQTYSRTEVYSIGEELMESYTFGPNGTIAINDPRLLQA